MVIINIIGKPLIGSAFTQYFVRDTPYLQKKWLLDGKEERDGSKYTICEDLWPFEMG